ncbi:LPS translocon maturation chaperone LptM [Marinomonas gallaica]
MVVIVSKPIFLLLATLVLSGCGNKGALYLPQQSLPADTVSTSSDH